MSGTYNILVISDLHLGEDLSPTATAADTRHVELVERHLVDFLKHYTRRRLDGSPWRLVINGDGVEFLGQCLRVEDVPGEEAADIPREDRIYGLGRRPAVARAKMHAIIARHQEFFRALARFLATGNRVEVIIGNHDTELHWPEVQEAFRAGVAALWAAHPAAERDGAADAARVVGRIGFHPWFFYEPGTVWIEHGHQYDETCSFEYGLNPVDPHTQQIISNVDGAALRYVTSHNAVESHGAEDWSFLGYIRLAIGLGVRGCWKLFRSYSRFAMTLINAWRGHASLSRANRERREVHHARLSELARSFELEERTLHDIDDMRRPPVPTHLSRLLKVLMIDKLLLSALTVLAVVLCFAVLPLSWALLGAACAAAGSWAGSRLLARGRMVNPTVPLLLVPGRIVRKVDVRFVVFGHTHDPLAQQLDDGRWYFNTGTWLPTGKPGLLRAFTHVLIRHTEHGPVARLCQWRDGASREFTPGWAPGTARPQTTLDAPAPAEAQIA